MIDFRLTARRAAKAAKAFLNKAIERVRLHRPLTIVTDKAPTYRRVIREINCHYDPHTVRAFDPCDRPRRPSAGSRRYERSNAATYNTNNQGPGRLRSGPIPQTFAFAVLHAIQIRNGMSKGGADPQRDGLSISVS